MPHYALEGDLHWGSSSEYNAPQRGTSHNIHCIFVYRNVWIAVSGEFIHPNLPNRESERTSSTLRKQASERHRSALGALAADKVAVTDAMDKVHAG